MQGRGLHAAQGNVETTTTQNGNTALTVQVKHLAPPEKVASGASTYVVWATPMDANAEAQNLGALTVDTDRTGELRTLTSPQELRGAGHG